MSKKKELATVDGTQLPDFMKDEEVLGTEDLSQFIIPPRIKVVQKQSGAPFDELFKPGQAVIVPQMIPLADVENKKGEPFHFVPLFFYPEWCTWNPLEMKGTLPAIRKRTTDPKDPLVAKCRNRELWFETCPENPEGKPLRNVEHLNYIVMLVGGHELDGTPMIMSFSKGEHSSGSNFAALIKMGKAPMYGRHYEAAVAHRPDNPKGAWYGINVTSPSAGSGITPFVSDLELFQAYKSMHLELKQAHEDGMIQASYEDQVESEPSDSVDTEF